MNPIFITTFYRFKALTDTEVQAIKMTLESSVERTGLRGLCLLGNEGINATISGSENAVEEFKRQATDSLKTDLFFKDSRATKHPFQVFRVKIKNEIVTLGKPGLMPAEAKNNHLSPKEWHQELQNPDTVVIDTRNDYEVEIGKFKRATDFALKEFNEFPEKIQNSGLKKDQRVLLYCTGGIRCEKAILEMNNQGFNNVAQLDGGILNYLKEFPDQEFAGECFVFDYRVAVDQKLEPTRQYGLCPHCGQPSYTEVQCSQCGRQEIICKNCSASGVTTCSKNCAHHATIRSKSSKSHIPELIKRNRR